jgi:hypothetical protein
MATTNASPWDKMCIDLIGPYTIRRKGKNDLICKCVTMIVPATGWFEIHQFLGEMNNADLNELAITELILSIDVSNRSLKIAFGIFKICKTKDEDGNATWKKLKKKIDSISAPLLVKIERMFRESKCGKNEDPEIWINNFEDLVVKLEIMGSNMTDEQFLIQHLKLLIRD